MEAEDETGTLQQLKATLQMELQHDDDVKSRKSASSAVAASDKDDEEHDGYGSDFEEEEVIRYATITAPRIMVSVVTQQLNLCVTWRYIHCVLIYI